MLKSTVFHILLVVGVFLAAECRAEQPLEDEGLQELQDEDLQDLQDGNPSQDEQEPQDNDDDGLQALDEDQDDDDSDDVAQESQDEQEPSEGRQSYIRRVYSRCFRGTTTLTCPTAYRYRLSCGIRTYTRSGSYNRLRYSYPYLSRSCRCYGYRAYCTALCTNKPTTMSIRSSYKSSAGTRYVYCPTGYKALGCNGRPYSSSERYASSYPVTYSSSSSYFGRVCACYSRYRFRCYASCGRLTTSSSGCPGATASPVIRSIYGRGMLTATCPSGKYVLGCGISPRTSSTERYREYYPYGTINPRSCRCGDYGYARCYAICG